MILEVWGGAALLVALAYLYGRALDVLGLPTGPATPAVGFAIELIVADIGSELPGLAVTGAILLLLLAIAALAVCVRRGPRPRLAAWPWSVLLVGAFFCALPFLANGRVGLLGVSLDNDTAAHLVYAAALASSSVAHLLPAPTFYPLAPHALAAALTDGAGIRLDAAFDAFTIATLLITALVGAAALGRESWWRRLVAGIVVAFFYLEAAYYGEDSFKELILGGLLLGFVLCLEGLGERWPEERRLRPAALLAPVLLFVGGVYAYGYLAAVWFVLAVVLWVVLEVARTPRRLRSLGPRLRGSAVPVLIALVAAVVLLLPITNRLVSLFSVFGVAPSKAIAVTNTGDLSGSISPFEALGIWASTDFRAASAHYLHRDAFDAFALVILLFGVGRELVLRRVALVAGVLACLLVYLDSAHGQSAYVTAKSLAIASPLVALVGVRGLLATDGAALSAPAEWLRRAAAAVFVAAAMWTSGLVLRSEPVWPMTGPDELLSFAHATRGSRMLFLGDSEYAVWIFDRSRVEGPPTPGTPAALGLTKPATPGTALDWDNESPSLLDRYQWVVTTNSPNASQPPAAFHLVRRLAMYELWRRVGPVASRETLDPPNDPGAVLDCSVPGERRISRQHGFAALMTEPIATGVGVIPVGGHERVPLALPAGRWKLSVQYVSGVPIKVSSVGQGRWTIPAYLDEIGPFFQFATVRSTGAPIPLSLHPMTPSIFTDVRAPFLEAQVEAIVATKLPDTRTVVPLRHACGHYVDWYRVTRR